MKLIPGKYYKNHLWGNENYIIYQATSADRGIYIGKFWNGNFSIFPIGESLFLTRIRGWIELTEEERAYAL